MEICPNKEGVIRDVKDAAAPPRKSYGSYMHNEDVTMIKIKMHINKLIVIHQKENNVNDDDKGHGRAFHS